MTYDLRPASAGLRPSSPYLRRIVAFAAMMAIGLAFRTQYLGDWDSWDYTAQAIQRHSSDLLLGRWWFIASMRAAYLTFAPVFGLGRLEGYLVMQIACALAMAGAVVVGMALTWRLTRSARAEMLFAAMAVLSPMICVYTYSVMTEGMTLLTLGLAFWAWLRAIESPSRWRWAWAALSGAAVGIAVDMREPAILLCAWYPLACWASRGGWKMLIPATAAGIVTLGIGVLGAWAWYPWLGLWVSKSGQVDLSYFAGIGKYVEQMTQEKAKFPVSLPGNLWFLFQYSVAAMPIATFLAVPAVIWALVRRKWQLAAVAAATLPLFGANLLNHDLAVNPRHPIASVWVLAIFVACALDDLLSVWPRALPRKNVLSVAATVLIGAVIMLIAWPTLKERYFDYIDCENRIYLALRQLPRDAVLVPGPGTPTAYYLMRLQEADFDVIGSGWAWPEELDKVLAEKIAQGKSVYVYLGEDDWKRAARKSGEWEALQKAVAKYRQADKVGPLVKLEAKERS